MIRILALLILTTAAVEVGLTVWAADQPDNKPAKLLPLKVNRATAPRLSDSPNGGGGKSTKLTPLRVNKATGPRLSDAPMAGGAKPGGGPQADNSACFVCHGNYQNEPLVTWHSKENIGCKRCHGESVAHRNDEDHRTPPDIMYTQQDIDAACAKCHETHDVAAKKVIARWQEKCPARTNPAELVCTDCHGEHRLQFRSYWWDKRTREFIAPKPGGPRIKMAPDLTKKP